MYKKILVPLDGSKLAECVLPHVEELAGGCGVEEIILLRIGEPPTISADYPENMSVSWDEHVAQIKAHAQRQGSLYLDDAKRQLKDLGANVRTESRLGKAASEIVDYAAKNGIDLIVMASHGRSGPSRWAYGSVAEKVFRSTCIPVLMIRAPGCVTGI